jgi:hypothetical protein
MKGITLIQPWASLWLTDRKVHETRLRRWPYSGWLAVHAGKTFVTDLDELGDAIVEILNEEFGVYWHSLLPTGSIIGAVNMVSCLPMTETAPAHGDDGVCGNWAPKRHALRRTDVIRLQEPIPFRGYQHLFDIPDAIAATILDPARAAA